MRLVLFICLFVSNTSSHSVFQSGLHFIMRPKLASNSRQSSCLSLSAAGMSGVRSHAPPRLFSFNKNFFCPSVGAGSQPDSFPSHLGRGPRSVSLSPSRWGRCRDARGGSRKGVSLTPRRPPAAPAFCADRGVRWGRRPRQARPGRPSSAQPAGSCPAAGAPHPCSSKRRISGWGAGSAAGSGRGRGPERIPRARACWSDPNRTGSGDTCLGVRGGLQPGGKARAWGVTAGLGRSRAAGRSPRPGSCLLMSPKPAPR